MKLYTEEQVIDAIIRAKVSNEYAEEIVKTILSEMPPIELPSDEEIHKQATNFSNFYYDFRAGAEWMKEQILNQNK